MIVSTSTTLFTIWLALFLWQTNADIANEHLQHQSLASAEPSKLGGFISSREDDDWEDHKYAPMGLQIWPDGKCRL